MKKSLLGIISTIAISLLIGCEKKIESVIQETTDLANKSFLKIYASSVNASRNYVYLNTKPLTSGVALAAGSTFPSNVGYSAIDPGSTAVNIVDTLKTATQPQINFNYNFELGKYYSIFTYDTVTAIKFKVVEDVITIPSDTSANIRFANMAYSRTAIPNVDLFSQTLNRNIFTNVPVGGVTDFTSFPTRYTDTLFVRHTGTQTNIATTAVFSLSPDVKRSYTVVFRGGTVSKLISAYVNR
jgi:hypothetical protein